MGLEFLTLAWCSFMMLKSEVMFSLATDNLTWLRSFCDAQKASKLFREPTIERAEYSRNLCHPRPSETHLQLSQHIGQLYEFCSNGMTRAHSWCTFQKDSLWLRYLSKAWYALNDDHPSVLLHKSPKLLKSFSVVAEGFFLCL